MKELSQHRYYKHFCDICGIPHGSGNEKALSDHVVRFAKDLGLEVHQDSAYNVVIKKPGTPGYENAPPVVLQCHLDMVCEKEPDSPHNFETDPIAVEIVDGFLTAKGTTLGADDGIGIGYIMCVLEDPQLAHPPLEAVFTTNEEVGMEGMIALDINLLKGRQMINLDSGGNGVLITSCAGGVRYELDLPVVHQAPAPGSVAYRLSVQGLCGGHSGADIHIGRANGILLMARILGELFSKYGVQLSQITGGEKDNSIPAYGQADVWIAREDEDNAVQAARDYIAVLTSEYAPVEPDMSITLEPVGEAAGTVLTAESLQKALAMLQLAPYGAFLFSPREKGAVISSSNVGIVRTHEDRLSVTGLVRANIDSKTQETVGKLQYLAALTGTKLSTGNSYPAWEYRDNSPYKRPACPRTRRSTAKK